MGRGGCWWALRTESTLQISFVYKCTLWYWFALSVTLQRSAKRMVRGCEKFLPVLAWHFCAALPGSCLARFAHFLAGLCIIFGLDNSFSILECYESSIFKSSERKSHACLDVYGKSGFLLASCCRWKGPSEDFWRHFNLSRSIVKSED